MPRILSKILKVVLGPGFSSLNMSPSPPLLSPGVNSHLCHPQKPPETQRAEGDYECPGSILSESVSQEGEDVNHMALLELYPIHLASLLPLTGLHGILFFFFFFIFFPFGKSKASKFSIAAASSLRSKDFGSCMKGVTKSPVKQKRSTPSEPSVLHLTLHNTIN